MKIILYSFLITFTIGIFIDGIWLFTMSRNFYNKKIGHLMAENPNLFYAAIFYLIYVFGITFFVLSPAINENYSILKVFFHGALFGFIAYSTYDLTNQATLKDWPLIVTIVDIVWGTLFTGTLSTITFYIIKILYLQ